MRQVRRRTADSLVDDFKENSLCARYGTTNGHGDGAPLRAVFHAVREKIAEQPTQSRPVSKASQFRDVFTCQDGEIGMGRARNCFSSAGSCLTLPIEMRRILTGRKRFWAASRGDYGPVARRLQNTSCTTRSGPLGLDRLWRPGRSRGQGGDTRLFERLPDGETLTAFARRWSP
jgi:hypothetical protein